MKMFKGYRVVYLDGTTWYNTCPKWAAGMRAEGFKVERAMIMGKSRSCSR